MKTMEIDLIFLTTKWGSNQETPGLDQLWSEFIEGGRIGIRCGFYQPKTDGMISIQPGVWFLDSNSSKKTELSSWIVEKLCHKPFQPSMSRCHQNYWKQLWRCWFDFFQFSSILFGWSYISNKEGCTPVLSPWRHVENDGQTWDGMGHSVLEG